MTDRPTTSRLVDFARGDRSYVHSIDMIKAAPISVVDKSFRFRFHGIVKHPGHWLSASAGGSKQSAKAELVVERGEAADSYFFTCPDETAPLARAADFDFAFDPAAFRLEDRSLSGPLQPGFDLWQQLTEAVRHGGELLFPGGSWLTVGISASGRCCAPVAAGTRLTLDLLAARGNINSIRFTTSVGAQGRILTAPKHDHDI